MVFEAFSVPYASPITASVVDVFRTETNSFGYRTAHLAPLINEISMKSLENH